MVTRETLNEIFEEAEFRDTRDNWRGLCPFHLESTPSFYIHKDELVGHCFGCGISGRLDILVARYTGSAASQARDLLGLDSLPWLDALGREKPVPEPIFPQTWIRAWKKISMHPYLERRGFTREIVEAFEMRWDPIQKRVVWPLVRDNGRVVGAVGRATTGREPKYLFYWNCDKGQFFWTAPHFYNTKPTAVYVVEGILDCMWMWQAGLQNTVALIGAHATKHQIRALRAFERVVIGLDRDKAGLQGALDLGEALKSSCDVRYIKYPEYAKDAADLLAEPLKELFTEKNYLTPLEMKLDAS